MGKGDARRPTAVDDRVFEDRWARAFGTPLAPSREGVEPPNGGSEVFEDRANDDVAPDHE